MTNLTRRLILAVALMTGISPAAAQVPNFPQTMPSDSFVGRIQPGSGPSSAIPIAALLARIATPNSISNSVLFKAPAATLKGNPTAALANVQDFTIQGLPARGAPDANNDKVLLYDNATGLFKYVTPGLIAASATSGVSSIDGVVNALTVQSGSLKVVGSQLSSNTLSSRAFAITQNLSAFSTIRTLHYDSSFSGGGATFKNVGSAPFIDSFITTYTIAGGSGCTNNSYFGVVWQSGTKSFAVGTATAAGGTVTAVNVAGTPGNAYAVGDVLTTTTIPGCTGLSLTVTGVSTPLASFTDSVGTHWQFVPDGFPNILQFGAKGDWNGTDGTATDNFNAIQAASWFAAFKSSTSFDAGGYWGGKVVFPSGSYMAGCSGTGSLIVGQSVVFEGPSEVGAQIKLCNSFSSSTAFIEICDPNWHFACFGSKLKNISVFADRAVGASAGTYMIHSNNVQDFGGLDHVYIYAGQRGCTDFEHGYGGASTVSIRYVSCNAASTNTIMMLFGNTVASGLAYGTTIFEINDLVMGGPSSCSPTCQTQPGIVFRGGGFFDVNGVHCENAGQFCITVDIPATANGDMVRLHNINAGWGAPGIACVGAVFLTSTNNPGNTIMGMIPAGSCPAVVTNGQSGGSNRTAAIVLDVVFNP